MTLQEAKQKVANNHSYVDWYQLRAHCKGFEGDIDPRMLTYADEAAEIYCASQVSELTKEVEWYKGIGKWDDEELVKQNKALRERERQLVEALREYVKNAKYLLDLYKYLKVTLPEKIESLLNNQPDEKHRKTL